MSPTPGPWVYGVRKDGSMWLSLGNPKTGPHYQGDLVATEQDARLIVSARELLDTLKGIANANWREWEEGLNSPEEFVRWAKNVAVHAIAKATGGAE